MLVPPSLTGEVHGLPGDHCGAAGGHFHRGLRRGEAEAGVQRYDGGEGAARSTGKYYVFLLAFLLIFYF